MKKLAIIGLLAMFASQGLQAENNDPELLKRIAVAVESIAKSLEESTKLAAQYSSMPAEEAPAPAAS